jgi:Domain of unknown function (DUF4406)
MSLDKTLTYYLAGKMTGVPKFNIPMFDRVASELRVQGYKVVSPAELDNPRVRAACLASTTGKSTPETNDGGTWADFLARDVKLIADKVDGIIMLPGWETSNGARLEMFVGLLTKKKFGWWDEHTSTVISDSITAVRHELKEFLP